MPQRYVALPFLLPSMLLTPKGNVSASDLYETLGCCGAETLMFDVSNWRRLMLNGKSGLAMMPSCERRAGAPATFADFSATSPWGRPPCLREAGKSEKKNPRR